jgi:hypothetical protein
MRWIVHPSRARRLAHAVFVLGVALLAAGGCGSDREPSAAPAGSRFGADYEIVLGESPAAPDEPPVLRGDTLTATVAYRGGEETHDFTLGHEVREDTARLWLRHDAAGEEDTARVLDEVRLPAPPEALDASTVVLLNPQGGEPFVLRWPGE